MRKDFDRNPNRFLLLPSELFVSVALRGLLLTPWSVFWVSMCLRSVHVPERVDRSLLLFSALQLQSPVWSCCLLSSMFLIACWSCSSMTRLSFLKFLLVVFLSMATGLSVNANFTISLHLAMRCLVSADGSTCSS